MKLLYFVVKYMIFYTLLRYELDFAYRLFNPLHRISWGGLYLAIGIAGFDLAIYYLLRRNRLLNEWDCKISKKIFRIHDYK
jgi:hypothetical protein